MFQNLQFIPFTTNLSHMKGLNKVTFIGNLGADPTLTELDGGICVGKASLATTEWWRDKSGQLKSETSWHPLVFWGSLAKLVAQHCKKGARLYVEGKLKTRQYLDKEGQKKYVSEIVVDSLLFL